MCSDLQTASRPAIHYRPGVPKPARGRRVSRRPSRLREDDLQIILDLPVHPPVTSAEVKVIETWLADRIDALLARCVR